MTTKDKKTQMNSLLAETQENTVVLNEVVPTNAQWFVLHTYSGHENKVAVALKQRTEARGFTDRIFTIMIPQQKKIVVSDGKKKEVTDRLFPGYVLIQMIMGDDAWYLVRSTKGITGFVGMGNNPTPLHEKEVKTLIRYMDRETPKFEAKFMVGDSVKITGGPFSEFLGKVDEVNEEQGKVKVLVSVFGRETPVELDFTQVKSI